MVGISCLVTMQMAQASGLDTAYDSAAAIGLANADLATSENVSAAANAAAGLAWQPGKQLMVGSMGQYRNSSVKLGNNSILANSGRIISPNYLYASWKPKDSDFGLSFAYHTPIGLDNNWPTSVTGGDGRTDIRADRFAMDGIYAVNSNLAFAIGADMYKSKMILTQGGALFSGKDAAAFSGHASMKYKFSPSWVVAASLHKGAKINASSGGGNSATLQLPDEIKVGLSKAMVNNISVEMDVRYSRWSQLKNLNVVSNGVVSQSNNLSSLKNDWGVMLGSAWHWRPDAQLRLGFAYDSGRSTLDAGELRTLFSNQKAMHFTTGLGADIFGVHVDAGYAYVHSPKRTITGALTGTYRERRQIVACDITKKF
ncbi:MAG: outer membrane protein transport protein [Zetaproteobacteria bacterium]|nr:outer membrane protein transport protein [Zetaproteobacteria bacterium]